MLEKRRGKGSEHANVVSLSFSDIKSKYQSLVLSESLTLLFQILTGFTSRIGLTNMSDNKQSDAQS